MTNEEYRGAVWGQLVKIEQEIDDIVLPPDRNQAPVWAEGSKESKMLLEAEKFIAGLKEQLFTEDYERGNNGQYQLEVTCNGDYVGYDEDGRLYNKAEAEAREKELREIWEQEGMTGYEVWRIPF